MKEYTKLIRIKYNNRLFDVFSDNNHKKVFLEVKIENGQEKYYQVSLKDLINLNLIYNTKSDILYEKKYRFDLITVIAAVTAISNLSVMGLLFKDPIEYKLNKEKYLKERIEFYRENNYADEVIVIKNNSELDNFGFNKVTFSDVRNTLANNNLLSEEHKLEIEKFLLRLEERLPEVDLRIFNENLKTLKITTIKNDEWTQKELYGFYNKQSNQIFIKDYYENESIKENVITHELGHTLNNAIINYVVDNNKFNEIKIKLIYKDFASYGNDSYGDFGVEGFNTILTKYLLTDDWENFFNQENIRFISYQESSICCFEMMKLLNYSFYDYLNNNIDDLINRLNNYAYGEYSVNDIVDSLDIVTYSYKNNVDIDDYAKAFLIKEELIKQRLKKIPLNEIDEIEFLIKAKELIPYGNYDTFKDFLCNKNNKYLYIEKNNSNDTTTSFYLNTTIIDGNNKIENIDHVIIYKKNEKLHFGYQNENNLAIDLDGNELSDLDTNIVISLNIILNRIVGLPEKNNEKKLYYNVIINNNILEEEMFKKTVLEIIEEYTKHYTK